MKIAALKEAVDIKVQGYQEQFEIHRGGSQGPTFIGKVSTEVFSVRDLVLVVSFKIWAVGKISCRR